MYPIANAANVDYTLEPSFYGKCISQKQGSDSVYHHFDALGSFQQPTDALGVPIDGYNYTAYGAGSPVMGTVPNLYQFVGEIGYSADNPFFLYIRRRWYLTFFGRWASRDFFQGRPYQYADNDPAIHSDASGLITVTSTKPLIIGCGQYLIHFKYESKVDYGEPVTVVQLVTRRTRKRLCAPHAVMSDCCVVGAEIIHTCTFYEAMVSPAKWESGNLGSKRYEIEDQSSAGDIGISNTEHCTSLGQVVVHRYIGVYRTRLISKELLELFTSHSPCPGSSTNNATKQEPAFYRATQPKHKQALVAEGEATFSFYWDCCNCSTQTNKYSWRVRTDPPHQVQSGDDIFR